MKTLMLNPIDKDIETAGRILREGGLVAIPTETVYGLGANALNPSAVNKIFQAKGRPNDNPLIVHISDISQIKPLVKEIPEKAKMLMTDFWPGPLTIILPKTDIVPQETSGGLDTVAVRFPANETAQKIISCAGVPIAAPSANTSGLPSPTKAQHVFDDMDGKIDAILDGGECKVGVESTVITLATEKPRLLRPGGVTLEMLRDCIGEVELDDSVFAKLKEGERASSPGMKYKHYSPKADVVIVKGTYDAFKKYVNSLCSENVFALCFEGEENQLQVSATPFGKKGNAEEQAHFLFDALRKLDEMGAKIVFTRCPDKSGVGMAVYNRLIRAAAYRVIDLEKTIVLGLTGATGAGKGFLSKKLVAMGFEVIDTDKIAHQITEKGSPILQKLQRAFGEDILIDGELDRKLLAKRVFRDKKSQKLINSITHPEIIMISKEKIQLSEKNGQHRFIIDAPLLFESGMDKICNATIAVICPDERLRMARVIERDGISEEQAKVRMKSQPKDEFYTEKTDFVVVNDGKKDVDSQIINIFLKM